MRTEDIIISDDFKRTPPKAEKLHRTEQEYLKTGLLPENIIIDADNVLVDGYTTYLAAVKYGVEDVALGNMEFIEGVHDPGSSRTFIWRIPSHLAGKISAGDRVMVRTVYGVSRVQVVNVIRQQYPGTEGARRRVIRKCRG